jgi:hypothetical protein
MRQKLDVGTILLAAGAILVLIALFLTWYRPGGNAWDVFEVVDIMLAAMAVTALVLAVGRLTAGERGSPGWMQGIALATLVLVAAEIIQAPPGLHGAHRESGAWLALAGSLTMVAGAVLHFAHISISIDVAERDRRRRVSAVDRRRAGAPGATGTAADRAGADAPTTRVAGRAARATGDPADDPNQRTQELRRISEDEPNM